MSKLLLVRLENCKKAEESTILKRQRKKHLRPPYDSLPWRSVVFHAPGIDRRDRFPEALRERDALIGQKLAEGLKVELAQTEAGSVNSK